MKNKTFFWASYADLMTSLFFVMLLLFVTTTILMFKNNIDIKTQKEKLETALKSTKDLSKKYFSYNDQHEKFVLNVETFFPSNRSDIEMLDAGCRNQLKEAGDSIKSFLDKHIENQYLLIVEGQASANSERMTMHNYNLSFQRALSLVRFWKEQGVNFGENVETQISGSGDGRWNYKAMREADEIKNQRLLINILPKNIFNDEESTN